VDTGAEQEEEGNGKMSPGFQEGTYLYQPSACIQDGQEQVLLRDQDCKK